MVIKDAKHALVVGGTGMLRGAVLALAESGWSVTVMARSQRRLHQLVEEVQQRGYKGAIHPVVTDYTLEKEWLEDCERAKEAYGLFQCVIAWIHGPAVHAPLQLARWLEQSESPSQFYHVIGSSGADPTVDQVGRRAPFQKLQRVSYHEVVLGFIDEGSYSRWLTHEEISSGVLHALETSEKQVIVGSVRPWTKRP
ncbi:SDR family NAD(P)-dependent oxidoreductase [Mechercharimyces sp. CAU 1602]|uniref:SDR family NAD(P)-dependent oxidoreductase n=1 Tax=Mechercharimyces sp. CAU 1602 TaxID=2973933 RepID=UPI002161422E|nr:SDR family NAD(P)-dependent oxidoreductase [Mechercharimyces sp. CAU 1602]MCS1351885.1 SDR family NAD(P)-dependent oxidoreductase [Mechercharimyces sp. CAU 1602]